MRRISMTLVSAALLFTLAACAGAGPAGGQAPQTAAPSAAPEASPAPAADYDFQVLPVTEEGIRTLYGWEGYTVREVTPYRGDFLVEYGGSADGDAALLGWVFGETGRRVQMTSMTDFLSCEITGVGEVRYTESGVNVNTPWKGLPQTRTVRVLGDGTGQLSQQYVETVDWTEPTWLDPAEPLQMGLWSDGALAPGGRYHQLYDARVDVDGLSFSFIPNGDSVEKFQSFFPAVTTIPCFDTQLDPAARVLTLRLYNTSLKSGGIGMEDVEWAGPGAYEGLYPYEFPAGSLGRDSHFLTDVTVVQDGEDAVVTARLTERAYRFTVESSNLGGDNIPSFRLIFREHNHDLDGWEAAE